MAQLLEVITYPKDIAEPQGQTPRCSGVPTRRFAPWGLRGLATWWARAADEAGPRDFSAEWC